MADAPTFQIPRDVIEPIIQAHIAGAVAEAFGDSKAILETAVRQILFDKVSDDGTKRAYGNEIPWVQWAIRDSVRKATKAAIETELVKYSDRLKAVIAREFEKGYAKSPLIKQLIDGMVGSLTKESNLKYNLAVTVTER